MEQSEETKLEKFTVANALDAAVEWVFNTTRLAWLFIIGVLLLVTKVTGSLVLGDTPWINVLWPFSLVVSTILIVALVFYVKYFSK